MLELMMKPRPQSMTAWKVLSMVLTRCRAVHGFGGLGREDGAAAVEQTPVEQAQLARRTADAAAGARHRQCSGRFGAQIDRAPFSVTCVMARRSA